MATAPVDLAKASKAALWTHQHLRKVIASLAGRGEIDGLEAMEILEGLDGLARLLPYLAKNADKVREALTRQP